MRKKSTVKLQHGLGNQRDGSTGNTLGDEKWHFADLERPVRAPMIRNDSRGSIEPWLMFPGLFPHCCRMIAGKHMFIKEIIVNLMARGNGVMR